MGHTQQASSGFPAVVAAVGVLIAAAMLASLLVGNTPPVQADSAQIEAAIKPVAVVEVADKVASGAPKSGEEIYTTGCAACHAAGMMNAPKFGDKAAWSPRIAKGYKTLVAHALQGFNAMPAKGGNSTLSDDEIRATVAYMANQAGASFK